MSLIEQGKKGSEILHVLIIILQALSKWRTKGNFINKIIVANHWSQILELYKVQNVVLKIPVIVTLHGSWLWYKVIWKCCDYLQPNFIEVILTLLFLRVSSQIINYTSVWLVQCFPNTLSYFWTVSQLYGMVNISVSLCASMHWLWSSPLEPPGQLKSNFVWNVSSCASLKF